MNLETVIGEIHVSSEEFFLMLHEFWNSYISIVMPLLLYWNMFYYPLSSLYLAALETRFYIFYDCW